MSNYGQLIFSGVSGKALNDAEKKFLSEENIGGVILFAHNYESPAQLAELINSIQECRTEYPLFIAVDQEGGRVTRFHAPFTQFPSMQKIAAMDSPKICFSVHRIIAHELSVCGVNLNLAPVCDILTNPQNKVIGERAFGSDEDTVSKYVSSAIRGMQTTGVMGCAKHFPGHGNTSKDSHEDLPYVKLGLDELQNNEIKPFIKASKARVEFMMMAHLVVDAIDEDLPCTLSSKAYEYLRNYVKFRKIILTDDMEMKAISDKYSTEQAAVMALKAGADMLEYRSMAEAQKATEAIKQAVQDGDLARPVLKEKLDRVLDCKKRNLSEYRPCDIPSLQQTFGIEEKEEVLSTIKESIPEFNPQG